MGVVNTFYPMTKNLVMRRRPYMDIEGVECLKAPYGDGDIYDLNAQGYSFPSGHAANSMTAYGGLAARYKKRGLRILLLTAIALICLSRVILGVHYPTDVLAGMCIGIISAEIGIRIADRLPQGKFLE